MSKSTLVIETPKSCEECKLCVNVIGKHYCVAKGTNIAKGERDCSCPLVAAPVKLDIANTKSIQGGNSMELISREEVINIIYGKIQDTSDYLQHNALIDVEFNVNELPSVEAVPVVHGEWSKGKISGYICSECKTQFSSELYYVSGYRLSNFCPECGADMRKKV